MFSAYPEMYDGDASQQGDLFNHLLAWLSLYHLQELITDGARKEALSLGTTSFCSEQLSRLCSF